MLQDQARLIMPAGIYGPAFLTFANFQAIRSYNQSDVYALFVGHLADLIAGGRPFEKPWAKLKPLRNSDVRDIQISLAKGGYYAGTVDGRLGTVSRQAIGKYQQATSQNVDCWPSQTLLDSLRHAPGPKAPAAPASATLPSPPAKRAAAPPAPAPQPKKPPAPSAPAASR
jgi:peptidoglycan hydrolase-like protein with peptidoglycan-binding domain